MDSESARQSEAASSPTWTATIAFGWELLRIPQIFWLVEDFWVDKNLWSERWLQGSQIRSWHTKYLFLGNFIHIEMFGTHFIYINSLDDARNLFDKRSKLYSDRPKQTMAQDISDKAICMAGFEWVRGILILNLMLWFTDIVCIMASVFLVKSYNSLYQTPCDVAGTLSSAYNVTS